MTPTLAAIFSLMSALIVAFAGHALSERRKRRDELVDFKLRAYSDFINSASKLVAAHRLGQTKHDPVNIAALNDAKTRICICADAPVVEALAEFWYHGGTLEKEQEILAFTKFCMRIRESLGNKRHDIANLNISDTLFRLEPSAFSFCAGKEISREDG